MSEPKRILQVLTTTNKGGAETMVMNCYRAIDRTKFQFDFLVHRSERGDFDDEIEQMGGRVFHTIPIRPWSYLAYFNELDKFFREHKGEFVAVHAHLQENSCFALKYAEKYGVKNRVSTSHAADRNRDRKFLFRKFAMLFGEKSITHKLACGQEAGECLYGDNAQFVVMHNPIDVNKFAYNEELRNHIRLERNWTNKLIIGNVARFGYPKNQSFIVNVFKEVLNKNPNACLVFVGHGPDMPFVKDKVHQLGLDECVFFEGLQSDIAKYLNAFDVIIHPSVFEGLPISIIEAQTSGLKCLLSDTIDKNTDVTGNVEFLTLKENAEVWAEHLLDIASYERKDCSQKVSQAGYDVKVGVEQLIDYYTK